MQRGYAVRLFTLPARCVGAAARRTRGVDGRGERRCSEVAAGVEQPTATRPARPGCSIRPLRGQLASLCMCAAERVRWVDAQREGRGGGHFLVWQENDVEFN